MGPLFRPHSGPLHIFRHGFNEEFKIPFSHFPKNILHKLFVVRCTHGFFFGLDLSGFQNLTGLDLDPNFLMANAVNPPAVVAPVVTKAVVAIHIGHIGYSFYSSYSSGYRIFSLPAGAPSPVARPFGSSHSS